MTKLIGGPYNGLEISVPAFHTIYYIKAPLSIEEAEALKIDEHISRKWPEAVYKKVSKTEFKYSHTVNY
jgi:hypothetical protein